MSTRDVSGAEAARGFHDMGGLSAPTVVPSEHEYEQWEKRVDALLVLLSGKDCRHMTVDELRRNIESLGAVAYERMGYYERWMHAITQTLIQRGVIHIDELSRKIAEVEQRASGAGR
ncbi:MAG: nitrile hydratase subunit beta [Burkholderiales bacterium]|nr:nitrile hydratase subunit beta [Burkholderiales bacterium]